MHKAATNKSSETTDNRKCVYLSLPTAYRPSAVWLYQLPGRDLSVSAAEHRETVDVALYVVSASQPAQFNTTNQYYHHGSYHLLLCLNGRLLGAPCTSITIMAANISSSVLTAVFYVNPD